MPVADHDAAETDRATDKAAAEQEAAKENEGKGKRKCPTPCLT